MSVSFSNQLTPTNAPFNSRILQDASLTVTHALADAAAWANTSHIDLGVAVPFPTTETINVYVSTGATAAGNTGNNGTLILQHTAANLVSADGTPNAVAWANITGVGPLNLILTDSATAAQNWTLKLPPGCLQFIRAQHRPKASGTDTLSGANFTLQLLF
jgi:hypothetical protein